MGDTMTVCGKEPELDPDFVVKSIKLPPR